MACVNKEVTTKTLVEESNFTWKIARFAEIRSSQRALELQKCQFEVGRTIYTPINLIGYLLVCKANDERNWIGVHFKRQKPPSSQDAKVLCSVSISHIGGQVLKRNDTPCDKQQRDSIGWDKLIPQDEISPWLSQDILDFEGNLCLQIKIKMPKAMEAPVPVVQIPLCTLERQFEAQFRENFNRDMANMHKNLGMLASKTSMIVKIISSDGQELLVHRGMLVARCPTLLKDDAVVKIDDISGNALKQLFSFLHTGVLSETWKDPLIIEGLIIAAHKYKLVDLQMFLDQGVGQVCTQTNCGKLLSLAIKFNMKMAERDLMEFFMNNLGKSKLAGDTALYK